MMHIDVTSGLLEQATLHVSPNCDTRPDHAAIELVVIHNISLPPGEFGGDYISQLFCNRLSADEHPYFEEIHHLKVSSHLLIRRDGEIIQYVPFNQRAWHAGESSFEGRDCCNDFSIGIELEGTDELPYTDAQYSVLNEVLAALFSAYPDLNEDKITGHCDISPGRKTDPGPAFDWARVKSQSGS